MVTSPAPSYQSRNSSESEFTSVDHSKPPLKHQIYPTAPPYIGHRPSGPYSPPGTSYNGQPPQQGQSAPPIPMEEQLSSPQPTSSDERPSDLVYNPPPYHGNQFSHHGNLPPQNLSPYHGNPPPQNPPPHHGNPPPHQYFNLPPQNTPLRHGNPSYPQPMVSAMEESYRPLIPSHTSQWDRLRSENEDLRQIAADQFQLIQKLFEENETKKKLEDQMQQEPIPVYPTSGTKPHGLAIIIGNEFFTKNPRRPRLQLKNRNGCQSDVHNFASCFGFLGYDVHLGKDMSCKEIVETFDKAMAADHSQFDSFVFCISTHGEENNYIFGSDSDIVNVYDLVTKSINVPSLNGKPKLFFIQACRMESTDLKLASSDGPPPVHTPANPNTDIAIFWATTRSSPAFRSSRDGSWFVTALHKVLTSKADHMDLMSMMYFVTDIVAKMEGQDKDSQSKAVQCVETNSQLRGIVKFVVQ